MNYAIGDTVVHWNHGIGTVVAIDKKDLAGETQLYYVVDVKQYKLWVPVKDANEGTIRFPTESAQFKELFDILRMPGEPLAENQFQRKSELRERMQKRTLEGLCHVIRDLAELSHRHTLNQNDTTILLRAEEHLLDEWELSLGVSRFDAMHDLEALLQANIAAAQVS
jgi:CarD family transcriptional regulator